MKTNTKIRKKTPSLAAKRAFVARSRSQNYRASLRLEGFDLSEEDDASTKKKTSKQSVIAKYRMAAAG